MERRLDFEFHHPTPMSHDADDYDRKEVYIQYLERKVEQYSSHSTRLGDELMTFCTETKEQTTSLQAELLKKENDVRDLKEKLREAEARAMTFSQRLDEMAQTEVLSISIECDAEESQTGPPEIARIYRDEFYQVTWKSTHTQFLENTDLDDSEIIRFLTDTFIKCFHLCKNAIDKQQENMNKVLQYPGANVVILTSEGRCRSHHPSQVTRMKALRSRRLNVDKPTPLPYSNRSNKEHITNEGNFDETCKSITMDKKLISHVTNCQRNFQESDLFLIVQDALRKCIRHVAFRTCCRDSDRKATLLAQVKTYVQKAVFVSWLMLTQEPAMHIGAQSTTKVTEWNSSLFDIYEGFRGDVVRDVVLPEVYFFEGGMVAAKGIVRMVEPPGEQDDQSLNLGSIY